MYYRSIGTGSKDIVLLHGWGRTHRDFLPLAKLLASKYRLHLFDLPGFGQSAAPADAWDTKRYGVAVFEALQERGIERFSIIGHSFGGRVALRIAAAQPEAIQKLVLIGAHGLRVEKEGFDLLRTKSISALRSIVKWLDAQCGTTFFNSWFTPTFGSRDYLAAKELRGTFVRVVSEDQSRAVASINADTLLLWGDRDRETPLALGQKFEQLMPNARLIVFHGLDHYPFLDVGAHLCVKYIDAFLSETSDEFSEDALPEVASHA